MAAKGINRYFAIHEMTGDPETLPVTPAMQKLMTTGDTMVADPVFVDGENFSGSGSRSTAPPTYIRDEVAGDLSAELISLFSGADNPLLLGALWADDWRDSNNTGPNISLEDAVLTASGSTLDVTGATNLANLTITDYDEIRLRSTANGNDGVYRLVETGTTNIFTVLPAVTADEICAVGVLMDGRTCHNGDTLRSFLFERGHTDISEYLVFLGMVPDTYTISIADGETVKTTQTFVGRVEQTPAAVPITGATYTDAPTASAYSVNSDTLIYLDGVLVDNCLFESLELSINNSSTGRTGAGKNGYCSITAGQLITELTLTMAFIDTSFRTKMKAGTPISLEFLFTGNDNSQIKITIPRIVIKSDSIPVDGPDDIVENAAGTAHSSIESGRDIQISEFPAY